MRSQRTLLRREESYAVHALMHVCESPGLASAEIAQRLQIPPAFLSKVLTKLSKVGLIASREGRGGGVWLRVPPEQISLLTVVEALSGPLTMDTCQIKELCTTEQRRGRCPLKRVWLESNDQVRRVLGSYTLDQLRG